MTSALLDAKLTIIKPSGHINAANAVEFQQQLTNAIASQPNGVLVDMHQVESLDSAALMALVSALRLALSLKRRFSLCAIDPALRIMFELTQLDRAFEIFETYEAFAATLK